VIKTFIKFRGLDHWKYRAGNCLCFLYYNFTVLYCLSIFECVFEKQSNVTNDARYH